MTVQEIENSLVRKMGKQSYFTLFVSKNKPIDTPTRGKKKKDYYPTLFKGIIDIYI